MEYIITASFENDGQLIDCSQAEVLGDAYGVRYATRHDAQEAADELAAELSDTGLDPSTTYEIVEVSALERGAGYVAYRLATA